MTALLLKLSPYLIAAAALLGIGGWAGYHLNPYPSRYRALQASDAIERAHGEEAVRAALTAQLAQAQTVTRNNQAAMVTLATQNAQTAADRDNTVARVHRLEQLLSATATRSAQSGPVSKANGGSDPPASRTSGGLTDVERLLVNAKEECEHTANDYDALVIQIAPQVKP